MDEFQQFISRWSAPGSLPPVSNSDVAAFERAEAIKLPRAYVRFVTKHGFPYTPGLLDAIVKVKADLWDDQNFEALDSISPTTSAYEAAGMPSGFLAFASDSMGNLFLLKRADCNGLDDAGVWFFDHDVGTIEREAKSFTEFVARYAALPGA